MENIIDIEFASLLGGVKTETTLGKALIFNIITDARTCECIMFVHENLDPFITLHMDDRELNADVILERILSKYTLKELLEVI
jgi:hypothetical protein